jgi:hypothetical protein
MMFYGTLSLGISIYTITITIILDIGSGYNEYNKIENLGQNSSERVSREETSNSFNVSISKY